MGNRYKEVLMTYLRRPFSSWRVGLFLAFGLYMLFSDGGGQLGYLSLEAVFIGVTTLGGLLWLQLREQMINPRRALMPAYAWPATAAFLAFSLPVVTLPPLLIVIHHEMHAGLPFAFAVYTFGLVGCAVAANSWLAILLCFFALIVPIDHLALFSLFPHSREGLAAISLFIGGSATTFWAIHRMMHIVEGDLGYGKVSVLDELLKISLLFHRLWYRRAARTGLKKRLSPDAVAVRPNAIPPGQLVHPGPLDWVPQIDRLREAQYPLPQLRDGIPTGNPGALIAALRRSRQAGIFQTGLWLILVPVLVLTAWASSPGFSLFLSVILGFPFVVVLPPLVVAANSRDQWRYMEAESLRPATRAQFIRSLFIARAAQVAQVWLAFMGSALCVAIILAIRASDFVHFTYLAPYCLASLLLQVFGCVLCLWILSHRYSVMLLVFLVAPLQLYVGFHMLVPTQNSGGLIAFMPTVIHFACLCALLGLILLPVTYRRWMNLEMG